MMKTFFQLTLSLLHRTYVDDLDARFLVLTNAINHFLCCLTHPNTAFDIKGDDLQNWVSKLISVFFFKTVMHNTGGPKHFFLLACFNWVCKAICHMKSCIWSPARDSHWFEWIKPGCSTDMGCSVVLSDVCLHAQVLLTCKQVARLFMFLPATCMLHDKGCGGRMETGFSDHLCFDGISMSCLCASIEFVRQSVIWNPVFGHLQEILIDMSDSK